VGVVCGVWYMCGVCACVCACVCYVCGVWYMCGVWYVWGVCVCGMCVHVYGAHTHTCGVQTYIHADELDAECLLSSITLPLFETGSLNKAGMADSTRLVDH